MVTMNLKFSTEEDMFPYKCKKIKHFGAFQRIDEYGTNLNICFGLGNSLKVFYLESLSKLLLEDCHVLFMLVKKANLKHESEANPTAFLNF